MDIRGYLQTSLLEWPGKISAVVFVAGCNFRCPFCYNRDLVLNPDFLSSIPEKEIFKDLKRRKKWIDGVVISGGEPLLQPDLSRFLSRCKQMGFKTMLETNGALPIVLQEMIQKNLVDYLAMDIKTSFEKYSQVSKCQMSNGKCQVESSIQLIMDSGIDYEFRTTVVPGIHDKETLLEMAEQLKKLASSFKHQASSIKWFLQNFQPKNCLDPEFEKIKPYSKIELEKFLRAVKEYIPGVELRG